MLWLVASADAARWVRDANRGATLSSHLTSLGLGFLIYRMRSPTAWSLRVGPGRCACACAHACACACVCVCTRACGGQGSHTPEARSLFVTTSSPEPPLLSPPDSGTAAGPPLLQLLPARHRLDTSHGRPLTGGLSSPLQAGRGRPAPESSPLPSQAGPLQGAQGVPGPPPLPLSSTRGAGSPHLLLQHLRPLLLGPLLGLWGLRGRWGLQRGLVRPLGLRGLVLPLLGLGLPRLCRLDLGESVGALQLSTHLWGRCAFAQPSASPLVSAGARAPAQE